VLNPQQRGREDTERREPQGLTIKLLEMELEKNKQVEKIGELKNKLFHIRSIVMNFIKSLDLKYLSPNAELSSRRPRTSSSSSSTSSSTRRRRRTSYFA
jgi:hypothetical protein